MKKFLLSALGALFLTGCMHGYDMTLINGVTLTRISKPRLDKGTDTYIFKDGKGQLHKISAARVVEIQPHSNAPKGPIPQQ